MESKSHPLRDRQPHGFLDGDGVMRYQDAVASLPVPTPEQTDRFGEHVAGNHSWYRHLPFFPPGASFVFFPNPQAGRGVRRDGDQIVDFDVETGDYFEHHSRLSTADYVAQFGHWDYWVDENPRVIDPVDGPFIYGISDGSPERLPDDLKRSWSCRLTAFLRPAPPMFRLRATSLAREIAAFADYAQLHPADPAVVRHQEIVRELRGLGALIPCPHPVWSLLDEEARAQRIQVTETLQRVRDSWANLRCGLVGPRGAQRS